MALTADQILTLRKSVIGDFISDRPPEWGSASVVRVSASVGAATLGLSGLGAGVIARGTDFTHFGAGIRRDSYSVSDSVTITAGNADVPIRPLLLAPAAAGEVVVPDPIRKSKYNMRAGRLFFSDLDLQDMADQADVRWTRRIAGARDVQEALFWGIELLALERMLTTGSGFVDALLEDDARGNARLHLDNLSVRLKDLHSKLDTDQRGPRFGRLFR